MTDNTATPLPALPEPDPIDARWSSSHVYTADQTRTYGEECATAASSADREMLRRMAEASQALLDSDRAPMNEIVGRDIDGHPLNAAGLARMNLRAVLRDYKEQQA